MFRTDQVTEVVAHRAGRIAFGGVLIAGAALLVNRRVLPLEVPAAPVMVVSWMAAFLAAALARRQARQSPHSAGALFKASIVVPSIGIALMLPLLIHMPFAIAMSGVAGFDSWVTFSCFFAGPAHLALAFVVAHRGARLVDGKRALTSGRVFLIVTLVACVPFVVFVVPPLIVVATGIPFIPLLRYQERLVAREHEVLGAELTTPRAIVYAMLHGGRP